MKFAPILLIERVPQAWCFFYVISMLNLTQKYVILSWQVAYGEWFSMMTYIPQGDSPSFPKARKNTHRKS